MGRLPTIFPDHAKVVFTDMWFRRRYSVSSCQRGRSFFGGGTKATKTHFAFPRLDCSSIAWINFGRSLITFVEAAFASHLARQSRERERGKAGKNTAGYLNMTEPRTHVAKVGVASALAMTFWEEGDGGAIQGTHLLQQRLADPTDGVRVAKVAPDICKDTQALEGRHIFTLPSMSWKQATT